MITNLLFIFLLSYILAWYIIPRLITLAHQKRLVDEPLEIRKIHVGRVPNLGGIAIAGSALFSFFVFQGETQVAHLNFLLAAAGIIFILGLADDLTGISPYKKIIVQLAAALLLVIGGEFRFTNLGGLFGIYTISYITGVIITLLFILIIVNAFNLIDGINCLAGGIGFFISTVFTGWFFQSGETGFSFITAGLCGGLAGFLFYNNSPAKIFMGDNGSMFIGLIMAACSIQFVELNVVPAATGTIFFAGNAMPFIAALFAIPLFDTSRVFIIRILNKKSPFIADRNHIHHKLLDLGLSHIQVTAILLAVNIAVVFLVLLFRDYRPEGLLALITIFLLGLNYFTGILAQRKHARNTKGKTAKIRRVYNPANHTGMHAVPKEINL